MRYGVPYKGSKNFIAEWVIKNLPAGTRFVDLFAGGCAVTHAAMLSPKWVSHLANDINDTPRLFLDAINGKFRNEKRWISREDFFRLKDTEPYVAAVWSFGNHCQTYMYAKELEPYKKALHYARVFGDFSLFEAMGIRTDGTRDDIKKHREGIKQKYIRWWLSQQHYTAAELDTLITTTKEQIKATEEKLRQYLLRALKASGLTQSEVRRRLGTQMSRHYFGRSQWAFPTQEYYEQMQTFMPLLDKDYNEVVGLYELQKQVQRLERLRSLQSLQSLESLERLRRLQRLERLERLRRLRRLQVTKGDYRAYEFRPGDVVYCDIPYKGTAQYNGEEFDYEAFYEWALTRDYPVYVSEYVMPEGFTEIASRVKVVNLSAMKPSYKTERIFVQKQFAKERAKQQFLF